MATFRPKVAPGGCPTWTCRPWWLTSRASCGWLASEPGAHHADSRLAEAGSRRHRAVFALACHGVLQRHPPLLGLVDTCDRSSWPGLVSRGVSVGATFINLLFWLLGFPRMSTTGLTAQAQVQPPCRRAARHPGAGLGMRDRTGHGAVAPVAAVPACHHRPRWRLFRGTDLCRSVCIGADLERPAALMQSGHHGVVAGHAGCTQSHAAADPEQSRQHGAGRLVRAGIGLAGERVAAASLLADYSTLGVGFWLVSRHLRRLDPGCGTTTPGSAGASGRPCCGCSP